MALTSFSQEEILFTEKAGGLVIARARNSYGIYHDFFCAVTIDGIYTDYPVYYPHDGKILWDHPEWFSKAFRERTVKKIMEIIEMRGRCLLSKAN